MSPIERMTELKRRRKRRSKLKQLKAKLAKAKTPADNQAVLQKINAVSPFWEPPEAAK